jgi:hypothetical protein
MTSNASLSSALRLEIQQQPDVGETKLVLAVRPIGTHPVKTAGGVAAFGADKLTRDCCPPVFSRRLYLTWPSYSHKGRQDKG